MTDDQRKEILTYMRDLGYKCDIIKKNLNIFVNIEGYEFCLKCTFPNEFPFEFPKIFVDHEQYKNFAPLPHVGKNHDICTFDKDISIPNFKAPKELVNETVKKAICILSEGIRKENINDFAEEFNAYWAMEASGTVDVIYNPTERCEALVGYIDEKLMCIAKSRKQISDYFSNLGINTLDESGFIPCLYLFSDTPMQIPLPQTNFEFLKYVKNSSTSYTIYKSFLSRNIGSAVLILFGQKLNSQFIVQVWMHPKIGKSLNKKRNQMKGFRFGHIAAAVLYSGVDGKEKAYKLSVRNMSHERLFCRGGNGIMNTATSAVILGCGSIGSFLIDTLAQTGTREFLLVDNQTLSDENIARHICGYECIGKNKTDAIKEILIKHNPNISCTSLPMNAFEFLDINLGSLNNKDYCFVVVGSTPLEYRAVELFNKQQIKRPIIILWVEPYLIGGHAIILNKPQDIFAELFDSNLSFNKGIVNNAFQYSKQEAGCQSTFMPYSGFEARRFIHAFIDYFMNEFISKIKQGNYLFSWTGKLSLAKEKGVELSKEWKNTNDNSTIIIRLD